MNAPKNIVTDEFKASRHANNPIIRAAYASFMAKGGKIERLPYSPTSDEVVKHFYPGDEQTMSIITRADASVLTTTSQASLISASVGAFFAGLPNSAGAKLIASALQVPLAGESTVSIPYRTGAPVVRPWVGESVPIPVTQSSLAGATLGPLRKAASITVFSASLARRAAAEAVFRKVFLEDAAATLDAAIFNDAAADSDSPAGLFNGVTTITGYAGGDAEAIRADLTAALVPFFAAGASANLAIICRPEQAVSIALLMPDFPWPVWPTLQITADRVAIVDVSAFAIGFGDYVDIDVVKEGVVHMSDTPLAIVDASGVVADPSRALWQTDALGMRLIVELAFVMRGAGRVAVIDGVSW